LKEGRFIGRKASVLKQVFQSESFEPDITIPNQVSGQAIILSLKYLCL